MTNQRRGNRDVILRLFEMMNTGSVENIDEVYDGDMLTVHPQTGERIQGLEANRAMARGFQELGGVNVSENEREFLGGDEERYLLTPLFTMVKIQGSGEKLVVTTKIGYPDGSDWYTTGLVTFRRGKILKQVLFFGPTFDPPRLAGSMGRTPGEREGCSGGAARDRSTGGFHPSQSRCSDAPIRAHGSGQVRASRRGLPDRGRDRVSAIW